MKLAASVLLLAMVVSAQEHHSVQKRQTTVIQDLIPGLNLNGVSRTIAEIDLSTVALLVFAFLVIDIVGTIILASVVGAGKRSQSGGWFSSWGMSDITGYVSNIYNSIDLVDTAFNYMDIEDETCRLKTVCEMENYAVNHPLAKLAINTVNNSLRGLERYQDAIDAGMNGHDCALIYDQCPFSYFGY